MILSSPRASRYPKLALVLALVAGSATAAPKYGPKAEPLSRRTNVEYFQKNAAPDFWALMPHYVGQPAPRACGATNLTWIVNAALAMKGMTSDQKNFSVESFVKQKTDKPYEAAVLGTGPKFDRSNVTNRNMARVLAKALADLKIRSGADTTEVVDVDLKDLPASKAKFIQALKDNEKSADDFIVISFIQGTLTGDPEGGAHVATIGGYDEKKQMALIMDPDREWYEPYWSPVDAVFDSVRDPKSDGLAPGWIHVRVK
jgi:hypothetical protein